MNEDEKKAIYDAVCDAVSFAIEQFVKREQESKKETKIFLDGKELNHSES